MVFRQDQFTEQAQEILGASQDIMRQLNHNQWDVEHILLALLEQEKGVAVDVLNSLEVRIEEMRSRIRELLDKAPKVANESTQIYVTPRAARALERAKIEAERLNDEFIGAEHILIAIVQEDQGDSVAVIRETGVTLEKIYHPARDPRRA